MSQLYFGEDYVRWARRQPQAQRWSQLASGHAPAVGFWYRTGPRPLVPIRDSMQPTPTDPPLRMVGMTYVDVGTTGTLLEFHAVPPQRTPATPPTPADMNWQPVFDAVALAARPVHASNAGMDAARRHRHTGGLDGHPARTRIDAAPP